jgi:F0F1-type ATP synthase membrane subunit b/b'
MATEENTEILTETRLVEIMGGFAERIQKSTNDQINGVLKSKINPVADSLADISKQLSSFQELSSQVEATKVQMSEIFTALQAPDDDPPQPTPQAIDIEAITAKITAEIKESTSKEYLDRIQKLESGIQEERQEKEKIRQQQIEGDRNNTLLASLKKIAPDLNLFPDHEDVVMSKLAKDGVLTVSEDGTSWMAKTKRQDPFTKQVEEVVVAASPDILKSIISESYSYYQQPRAGAGVNAAPTQSYNASNRKITDNTSAADIQKGFASNDQGMIDEIAAMIASGM